MGHLNVSRLAFLLTGMKQDHNDFTVFAVIYPVPGTDINFNFKNAVAYRFRIAKKSSSDTRQTRNYNLLQRSVERIQPLLERAHSGSRLVVSNLYRSDIHAVASCIVALKLLYVNGSICRSLSSITIDSLDLFRSLNTKKGRAAGAATAADLSQEK